MQKSTTTTPLTEEERAARVARAQEFWAGYDPGPLPDPKNPIEVLACLRQWEHEPADSALELALGDTWKRASKHRRAELVCQELARRERPLRGLSRDLDELLDAKRELWRRIMLLGLERLEVREDKSRLIDELFVVNQMVARERRRIGAFA